MNIKLGAGIFLCCANLLVAQEFSAGWIALDLSKALLPSDSLTLKVEGDLRLIKQSYPEVKDIHNRLRWHPGFILLDLSADGWAKYNDGGIPQFDSLNNFYGIDSIRAYAPDRILFLTFKKPYHSSVLAGIYKEVAGGTYRSVERLIDGNAITYSNNTYTFRKGWADCEAGCIKNHYWTFVFESGAPMLSSSYGDAFANALINRSENNGLHRSGREVSPRVR